MPFCFFGASVVVAVCASRSLCGTCTRIIRLRPCRSPAARRAWAARARRGVCVASRRIAERGVDGSSEAEAVCRHRRIRIEPRAMDATRFVLSVAWTGARLSSRASCWAPSNGAGRSGASSTTLVSHVRRIAWPSVHTSNGDLTPSLP